MLAAGIRHGNGQSATRQQRPHGRNNPLDLVTQRIVKFHLSSPTRGPIVESTARYGQPKHFLKTQGLRAELDSIGVASETRPHLVLDWVRSPIGFKLHCVRSPEETQPFRPDRKSILDA